jgi:hypothetical protein
VHTGSAAERVLPAIAALVDDAARADLAWLGETRRPPRLTLFFVGTRDAMRPLVGSTPGGGATPSEHTAFFVANDSVRPPIRHELMHVLAWNAWGVPTREWISEGVATVAAGGCRGYRIDDVGAVLARDRRLVSIDSLRRFVFAKEEGAISYLSAASLVSFIDRSFGRAALREFWRHGDFDGARKTLGVDAATLEARWRADAGSRIPRTTWRRLWPSIHSHGCE